MTSRLTNDERRWAGDKFSRNLKALEQAQVFWLPRRRIIVMRCTFAARVFRLPSDEQAVVLGTYGHPFSRAEFLEDLEALLVKLETRQSTQEAHDQALINASAP